MQPKWIMTYAKDDEALPEALKLAMENVLKTDMMPYVITLHRIKEDDPESEMRKFDWEIIVWGTPK